MVLLSVRACTDLRKVSMLVLSEVLVVLTLCVVASALVRLHLYQSAYGLTLLRLACTVTAAWIGLVFVIIGVAVARLTRPVDWLAPVVVGTAVVLAVGWAAANPAGIPTIVAAAPSLTAEDAAALQEAVCAEPSPDAQGTAFNVSKARSHDLLAGYCDRQP